MSKPIGLKIIPCKDGWAVVVNSLSQGAIALFEENDLHINVPDELKGNIRVNVTGGERMKFTKTKPACEVWREGFYKLPIQTQIERIGERRLRVIPPGDWVAIQVQYFKVYRGPHEVCSHYDNHVLAPFRRNSTIYRIERSIVKSMTIDRKEYNEWKESGRFEEVTAQGANIVGMCRNVQDIQKRKVSGSDRHPGYRTTTSPSFFKFK